MGPAWEDAGPGKETEMFLDGMVSNPVARATDPISSDIAGENESARKNAQNAVTRILRDAEFPLSDHQIHGVYNRLELGTVTGQRLRTARKELVDDGSVVPAGFQYGSSPTGGKAMTWAWAGKELAA